ncbi:MAG: methyl-accepting chemotaxis protein, partial [Thermodesulfobacteriota bacterium]|nr:methyl-accepting chemotaxis protein [Thermodesulfobacteriota bacterium]
MFKNLKLGTKIGSGFAIILFLVIVISFVSWKGMGGVVDRVYKADDITRMVEGILEARRQEKNFIIRKDTLYIDKVAKHIEDLTNQGAELKAKFNDPLNIAQIDNILGAVTKYGKSFTYYVEHENEKTEQMSKMRSAARASLKEIETLRADQKSKLKEELGKNVSGDKIFDRLTKADDANRLIKWFLDVRKNEKELIITSDNGYKEKIDANLDKIFVLSKDMRSRFSDPANIKQIDGIISGVKDYKREFALYVDIMAEQVDANNALVMAARAAQKECVVARADQKTKMIDEISSANYKIISIAFAAVLLGIIIAIFITRLITRPIIKGVQFAELVANGDLSTTLVVDSKDEVGQLFNALNTMVEQLQQIVGDIRGASDNVAAGSQELSSSSEEMSQGATEQAAAAEE